MIKTELVIWLWLILVCYLRCYSRQEGWVSPTSSEQDHCFCLDLQRQLVLSWFLGVYALEETDMHVTHEKQNLILTQNTSSLWIILFIKTLFALMLTLFAAWCCCCPLVAVQVQDSSQVGVELDLLFCPYCCLFYWDRHCPPEQQEVWPGSLQSSVTWMQCPSL